MSKEVQSWIRILKFMVDKPKTNSFSILYPLSRAKLATRISKAATEMGLNPIKLEINPFKEYNESPRNLSGLLDNLGEKDFLVVVRGNDFIKKLHLNRHFNTYSGLVNGKAKSIVLHMLIDDSNMTYLCDLDYKELVEYTSSLKKKVETASRIRIQTAKGTDITCEPRSWINTPIKPGNKDKNALLPAGQVYSAPKEDKTNGTLVIDKCISEFPIDFKSIIPFPEIKKDVILEIKEGKITSIEGCSEVEYLEEECLSKVDKGGKILSEITFGTNPKKCSKKTNAIQEILRDTVHFGFGLNTHLGGDIVSNVHWDAVIEFNHKEIEIIK